MPMKNTLDAIRGEDWRISEMVVTSLRLGEVIRASYQSRRRRCKQMQDFTCLVATGKVGS